MSWPIGFAVLAIIGWGLIGLIMHLLRWHCLETKIQIQDSFRAMDFWVGTTERLVAATLVINHSAYLPIFIGGWMTLKFAAHWQRESGKTKQVAEQSLLALVGGVISFSLAIGIGIMINPDALPWLKALAITK
jgi:hypothetical protein